MYWRADSADLPTFLRGAAEEGRQRVTCDMDGQFWEFDAGRDAPSDCPENYRCRYYVART